MRVENFASPVTDETIADLKKRADECRTASINEYHVMAAPYIARIEQDGRTIQGLREQLRRLQEAYSGISPRVY